MKGLIASLKALHADETGDMSNIATGAVSVLLAGLLMSVLSNAIQGTNGKGGLAGMLKSLMGGGAGGIASFLGM